MVGAPAEPEAWVRLGVLAPGRRIVGPQPRDQSVPASHQDQDPAVHPGSEHPLGQAGHQGREGRVGCPTDQDRLGQVGILGQAGTSLVVEDTACYQSPEGQEVEVPRDPRHQGGHRSCLGGRGAVRRDPAGEEHSGLALEDRVGFAPPLSLELAKHPKTLHKGRICGKISNQKEGNGNLNIILRFSSDKVYIRNISSYGGGGAEGAAGKREYLRQQLRDRRA